MTCKDCIHFDVCDSWYKQIEAEGLVVGEMSQQICEKFKNKADFVEVVRCKDCECFISRNGINWCEEHSDGWGDHTVYVDEDDFCSYGERKETK